MYALYNGGLLLRSSAELDSLKKIGLVVDATENVRRRIETSVAWFPVQTEQDIFNGDRVFTGSDGKATLQITNQASITLDADTLIVARIVDGLPMLKLESGSFQAEVKSGNFGITRGRETVTITPKDAKFKVTANGNKLGVTVQKGNLSVLNQQVDSSKSLELDLENKKAAVTDILAEALSPVGNEQVLGSLKDVTTFKWKSNKPAKLTVEFSNTTSFADITHKLTSDKEQANIAIEKLRGSRYWRLRKPASTNEKEFISEPESFRLVLTDPPTIELPAENDINLFSLKEAEESGRWVASANNSPAGVVDIQIGADSETSDFDFQVASDKNFKNVLHQGLTGSTRFRSPPLKEGVYYLRAKRTAAKTDKSWSPPRQFQHIARELQALPLLEPNTNAIFILDKPQLTINFKWENPYELSDFQIEIATSADFKEENLIHRARVDKSEVRWKTKHVGPIFWRVFGHYKSFMTQHRTQKIEIRRAPRLPAPEVRPEWDFEVPSELPEKDPTDQDLG